MLRAVGTSLSRGLGFNKRAVVIGTPSAVILTRKYAQFSTRAAIKEEKIMSHSNGLLTSAPECLRKPIEIPEKLLMGPGPTNFSPRVAQACTLQLGHMHAETFKAMDEIKDGLRYVFQTVNPWTLAFSGPGHLGMEGVLVNLLEPGEKVLIGVNGIWGKRAMDLATRIGAKPVALEQEVGKSFSIGQIRKAVFEHQPKVLFLVHSESSSGVMQPLEGVGDLCRQHDCLLVVDTVASLGGVPFYMDAWEIDAVYSGSQKVIGAPPGLAPCSFGPRAVAKIQARQSPIKSYLLDMTQLTVQWQCGDPSVVRIYHHTPATNLLFAMREALAEIVEEGLENVWKRHAAASQQLHQGLAKLGLKLFVEKEEDRLPTVTTIKVPEGVDWKRVIKIANDDYKVEIAGGLGPTVGAVFRIGVLGYNATPAKVDRVLLVLKESLEKAKSKQASL